MWMTGSDSEKGVSVIELAKDLSNQSVVSFKMAARVTITSTTTVWRLLRLSWLLSCLCWQASECVHQMSMCDDAMFTPSTQPSTQTPKVPNSMEGISDSTRLLILSHRPSKGPDDERRGLRVKKSTAIVVDSILTGYRARFSTPRSNTNTAYRTTTKKSWGNVHGRGVRKTTRPPPSFASTQRTTYPGHTTTAHGQAIFPCQCVISTSVQFSLYVISEVASPEGTSDAFQIEDACSNKTDYRLKDMTRDQVLNFNNRVENSPCSHRSGSDISIRVAHAALSLLLIFEEATDDLKVRCGTQSSLLEPRNKGQSLPSIKVIPRHGVSNKTGDVSGREQPDAEATGRSGVSASTLALMILTFICLVLLMLLTAFYLLWQRSKLDKRSSVRRRKAQADKARQKDNNYEEISEIYTTQTSVSRTDTRKNTNPDIQRQISATSSRKTDQHSIDIIHVPDNDDEQRYPSLDERKHSIPDGGNVLSLEYSTAKDSIKPRAQLSIPSNCTSRSVGLASYEDLPYRHHSNSKTSLTVDKATPVARSTPELPSIRIQSNHPGRSKSVSGLSAIGFPSHRPKRNWPSRNNSQTGHYFELERRFEPQSMDVSKLALGESVLDTSNVSLASTRSSTLGTVGHTTGIADSRNNCRGVSEGSISMQPGDLSTREDGPIYEAVTDDIKAETAAAEISGSEENTTRHGLGKKENPEKPPLKPRVFVPTNPYIIDLSQFNKSPKVDALTGSSSGALFPNTSCIEHGVKTPKTHFHTVSADGGSNDFVPSTSNLKPPCQTNISDKPKKGYHDNDDGVGMVDNDIYQSTASQLPVGENQTQLGPKIAGKDVDSGITLNDNDDDDNGDYDGPCGHCLNMPNATPTTFDSPMAGNKSHCHNMGMIPNSIYQSTGQMGWNKTDFTSGHIIDMTQCHECDGHLVLEDNSIYRSTRL